MQETRSNPNPREQLEPKAETGRLEWGWKGSPTRRPGVPRTLEQGHDHPCRVLVVPPTDGSSVNQKYRIRNSSQVMTWG